MKTMWIQLQIQTCFLQALRLKTAFEFAWQKDKRRCPVFSLPNSWPLGVFTKFYISIRGWYQWPFQATRERFFSSSLVRSLISPKFIERLGNSPRSYVVSRSFETQECMLVGRIFSQHAHSCCMCFPNSFGSRLNSKWTHCAWLHIIKKTWTTANVTKKLTKQGSQTESHVHPK